MLDAARWKTLSTLFDEAAALPAPARAGWLTDLRARDAELAAAAERMLARFDAQQTDTETSSAAAFDGLLRRALLDAPAPAPVTRGQRLGAWELQTQIGAGGMGQVWLAQRCDGLYAAQAAIKLLRSDRQQTHFLARFARERAALARLNHPGIAKLLDAGVVEGGPAYLVLEYVGGRTLAQHIDATCPSVASRVQLLVEVADAVAHAHGHLIVHRDIKPSNLMFTPDGAPKLLDFGIATVLDDDPEDDAGLTRQNGRVLTLGYAAPELITGAPADVAADVFSLGVLLYEMLTGCLPFVAAAGQTRHALEHAVLHTEPRRLLDAAADAAAPDRTRNDADGHVGDRPASRRQTGQPARQARSVAPPVDLARARGDLEAIIAKTLRKEPAERYRSVPDLAEDLRRWLQHRPVSARRDNRRHAAALWLRRHALAAGLAAALVLALSAGLTVSTWQRQRALAAARQSEHVTDYLSGLLASANPDANHGRSPNVIELLEKSRLELAARFHDEPDVRIRLLQVLATTYGDLNRYDLAAPLAAQWVALATERYGDDDARSVGARLMQARIDVPMGPWEPVVGWLSALQPKVEAVFGARSSEMHDLLICLGVSEVRVGRLDAAERHLAQARVVGELLYGPGSFERAFHHNYVANLYSAQGRVGLALQELQQTQREQEAPPPDRQRFALVLRRNTLAMRIRLGDYAEVEERAHDVLRMSEQLLGPGNALGATVREALAQYHADRAEYADALAEHQRMLAAGGSGTPPAVQRATRAAELLDRCLLEPGRAPMWLQDAARLQAELEAGGTTPGSQAADAWIALARCGLLLGDDALTATALGRLHDPALRGSSALLAGRVAQVEGEWQRARGDLPTSRQLLAGRVAELERSPDRRTPTLWAARLDLACTLVLQGDPEAAAAVESAAAERPPQMPAGHPLDAVQDYLRALLLQDRSATAVAASPAPAREAVERALRRKPGESPPGPLRLGGMFG